MSENNYVIHNFAQPSSQISLFEECEAEVRSYCRNFPTVFKRANGAVLEDEQGNNYLDFLAGAGTMNYGHNNPKIKQQVVEYLMDDGIVHSLDKYTTAKHDFITTFYDVILKPRHMKFKLTFPGPTGTNAVETALKFARLSTGRQNIIAFTNAFHGMTQGSLALSGNSSKREGIGTPLSGVFRVPFDGYAGESFDTAELLKKMLNDSGSGLDAPAAVILETVQAEGGLNVANRGWLQKVARVTKEHGALLIVDDIQAGCGRTGHFFSFEDLGIMPDIICLSKSLGGIGLPMSLVLLRPDLDVLKPGQHNGTFRGHNLAFVAAKAALEFWRDPSFETGIQQTASLIQKRLDEIVAKFPMHGAKVRGKGMMLGIEWNDSTIASKVSAAAFKKKLIIETSGAEDQVLKLLPPLTISKEQIIQGLDIIEQSISEVIDKSMIVEKYVIPA